MPAKKPRNRAMIDRTCPNCGTTARVRKDKARQCKVCGKPGAPTKYKPEYARQAEKLCILGAVDTFLADFFEVHKSTIQDWRERNPEFAEACERGKANADEQVERSLYTRATVGWSHEAVKIFMPAGAEEPVYAPYTEHYPPDTPAAVFWLKNRQPGRWKDKTEQEHSGPNGGPIEVSDARQRIAGRIAGLAARAGAVEGSGGSDGAGGGQP